MAVLKLSDLVTQISGKSNGSVFQKNGNSQIIRINNYSQNKKTPAQLVQQSKLQRTSQLWKTLTAAEKQSYVDEIPNFPYTNKVGETAYYSAYELFQKLNVTLFENTGTINATAPTFSESATAEIYDLDLATGQYLVYFEGNSTTQKLNIYATKPTQNESLALSSNLKFIQQVNLTNGLGVADVWSAYTSIFDEASTSTYIQFAVKVYNPDTGALTDILSYLSASY